MTNKTIQNYKPIVIEHFKRFLETKDITELLLRLQEIELGAIMERFDIDLQKLTTTQEIEQIKNTHLFFQFYETYNNSPKITIKELEIDFKRPILRNIIITAIEQTVAKESLTLSLR